MYKNEVEENLHKVLELAGLQHLETEKRNPKEGLTELMLFGKRGQCGLAQYVEGKGYALYLEGYNWTEYLETPLACVAQHKERKHE
jgi:hypothetical protein